MLMTPLSVTSARLVVVDLSGMKLHASKTKIMIVFRSRAMRPQSAPLMIGTTVLI